ncbi:MAG: LysM peptidoglycan-binding domain-containing protein [Chloroflexi bacterium]|nr:LysM peptidoglycan-binding domain-containing protein [Chloroflexota bacterium]
MSPQRPPRRSRRLLRARVHSTVRLQRPRPSAHFSIVVGLLAVVVLFGAFPSHITTPPTQPVLNVERFTLPGLAAAVPTTGSQALTSAPVPLTVVSLPTSIDVLASVDDTTDETRRAIEAAQASSSAPQASVDGGSQTERIPIFWEYEVLPGDTLSGIAAQFGIGVDYIRWNNVDVEDSDAIYPGLILQIPSVEGIIHSVLVNQTVTEIADRYDADWRDIVEFRANGLNGDPNNIQPGSLIMVPDGRKVTLVIAPPVRPGSDIPTASENGWVWPALGMLSSPFGPAHPLGIDIAAPPGTPVYAANSGQVSFVGGNPCCSYGYHIIIDHGNGYETLYAHMADFAVGVGGFVNAGDVIGDIGMTGRTTGPHVHFELRRNGVYQNPLSFLP